MMDTRGTKRSAPNDFAVSNRGVVKNAFAQGTMVWASTKDSRFAPVAQRLAAAVELTKEDGKVKGDAAILRAFTIGCCGFKAWVDAKSMVQGYVREGKLHADCLPVVIRVLDQVRFFKHPAPMKAQMALEIIVEATGVLSLVDEHEADGLRYLSGLSRSTAGIPR
ncbi:hypothetical protein LTR42_012157 [Elasticomyces elasticus]|nr:hypothetical protein LTR42_012157 [Elasticomyces elasticus]